MHNFKRKRTVAGVELHKLDDGGWEFVDDNHRYLMLESSAPNYRRAWEVWASLVSEPGRGSKLVTRAPNMKEAIERARGAVAVGWPGNA